MIYGDDPQKWNEWRGEEDVLNLHAYTYKPQATAVAQAGNLYGYCGGNPLLYVDPYGAAWYHWVIGGVIVAVAAAAVVVTAGGVVPAMYAVGAVASGVAAASAASTVAAGAFIGASMAYGSAAFMAALNSGSIKDFNTQGNWGVVVSTAAGAGGGSLYGYILQKASFLRSITFDKKQVQKKFKHASDYGIKGNWSTQNGVAFESAVKRQIQSVRHPILGTYRGNIQVYHFYDPKTGIDTMIKPDGSFYAGWKLSKEQIASLLRSGNVQ